MNPLREPSRLSSQQPLHQSDPMDRQRQPNPVDAAVDPIVLSPSDIARLFDEELGPAQALAHLLRGHW